MTHFLIDRCENLTWVFCTVIVKRIEKINYDIVKRFKLRSFDIRYVIYKTILARKLKYMGHSSKCHQVNVSHNNCR